MQTNETPAYDRDYYRGDAGRPGSDLCRKYDSHWWAYRYYAGLVRKLCRSGVVLELGCAHGYLLSFLDPKLYRKIGKDLSPYALDYARRHNPGGEFHEGSVERLPEIASGMVDVVVAKYVLEHLERPQDAIAELVRVLKPGGHFIFAVPNTSSLLRNRKGKDWIGTRDPTHRSVLPPDRWEELLSGAGLRVVRRFSDGFWDVPYVRCVPRSIQFAVFGWATILQTLFIGQWIPVRLGENLIVVARKP